MNENHNMGLQETLAQLSTAQLDAMLQAELEKAVPDACTVRLILRILREREAGVPVMHSPEIGAAWKRFEKQTRSGPAAFKKALVTAAAVLLLCFLFLFSVPCKADAAPIFDRIAAWTESFFQLFSPCAPQPQEEYKFRTDHPGLQQLYDIVTEQGVTVPVVPMWLDAGYVLDYCDISDTPTATRIKSIFDNGSSETIFEINIYTGEAPRRFHKAKTDAEEYESNGINHYIYENTGSWTIVWENGNVECTIVLDCPEDDVYRLIDAIYTMED